jgi:hypothetical protein
MGAAAAAVKDGAPAPPEPRIDPIAIGDAKADPVVFHENTEELADKFMRGETGTNPVQVNLGRIGSGQDIEDALALISSHLPPATGVQTHDATRAIAAALDMKPEDFLGNTSCCASGRAGFGSGDFGSIPSGMSGITRPTWMISIGARCSMGWPCGRRIGRIRRSGGV